MGIRFALPMRRAIAILALGCFAGGGAARISAAPGGKTKPGVAEAAAILAKTTAHTDIESPDAPAFILLAELHFTAGKRKVDGHYALSWAARNFYRETVSFPGFQQIVVASGGKLYRSRKGEALASSLDLWRKMLAQPLDWTLPNGSKTKESQPGAHWRSQAALECLTGKRSGQSRTVCLDPANFEPYRMETKRRGTRQWWTFNDYIALADKRFPSQITYRDSSGVRAEVDIRTLVAVNSFAPNEFTPPPGSVALH